MYHPAGMASLYFICRSVDRVPIVCQQHNCLCDLPHSIAIGLGEVAGELAVGGGGGGA